MLRPSFNCSSKASKVLGVKTPANRMLEISTLPIISTSENWRAVCQYRLPVKLQGFPFNAEQLFTGQIQFQVISLVKQHDLLAVAVIQHFLMTNRHSLTLNSIFQSLQHRKMLLMLVRLKQAG